MNSAVRTIVTFESPAFNVSEQKPYFINPCCFGDDLANWLAAQLRKKGHQADETAGQEDFGWFFGFEVSGMKHYFVTGYRPADANDAGTWIGWLERRGLIRSLPGVRDREVSDRAAQAVHEVLSETPTIQNIRWHFKRHFDSGREDAGTPHPLLSQ